MNEKDKMVSISNGLVGAARHRRPYRPTSHPDVKKIKGVVGAKEGRHMQGNEEGKDSDKKREYSCL